MRIQHVLIVAMVATMFVGCASKRRKRVVEQIESQETSSYWDGCDACDESALDATAEKGDSSGKLRCSNCQSRQDMLIDGVCLECIRQQKGDPNFSGFKNSDSAESPLPKVDTNSKALMDSDFGTGEFLPNKLPPKVSQPNPSGSNDFGGVEPPETKPNFVQAKDAAKDQLEKQTQSVIERMESVRDEIKSPVESLTQPALSPAESQRTKPRFESPLNELLNDVGQKPESVVEQKLPKKNEVSISNSDAASQSNNGDTIDSEIVTDDPSSSKSAQESNSGDQESSVDNTATKSDSEEQATDETESLESQEKRSTTISGNASVLPDPKFETFSLDDLFPTLDKDRSKQNGKDKPSESPAKIETSLSKPKRHSRPESDVVSDLQNNTINSRTVFDNTPEIPEQKIDAPEIVLRAIPVRPSKLFRSNGPKRHSTGNGIPTLQVKTQKPVPSDAINFSPLPQLTDMVDEVDLSVANSIADEVYDPYRFPEHGFQNDERTFEFNGRSTSDSETTNRSLRDKEDADGNRTGGILLRAVPTSSSTEIRNAIKSPEKQTSTAKFKFVQPKFQRPILDD